MLDRIKFVFVTTNRQPTYLHQSLASFFASSTWDGDPPAVEVVVDATEAGFLDAYRQHSRINVRTLSPDEAEWMRGRSPHQRCCYNHWRAMQAGLDSGLGVCVFEDDVIFREEFGAKLLEVIQQIELWRHVERPAHRYALAAYTPYDFDRPDLEPNRLYCPYDNGFYGLQAMYYSRELLPGLADYLWDKAIAGPGGCADLLVRDYCREGASLFAARCSLVQHIGAVTTGLGNFHTAPNFDRPWPGELSPVPVNALPTSRGHVNQHNARRMADEFVARIPECPLGGYRGRGIVMCGGGTRYFTCAYVNIRILRWLGCDLPVELWHLDEGEMNDAMRELVEPLGGTCVNASEVRRHHPVRRLGGWELKAFAMIHSRFREVLFLDADNVAAVDPTFLFNCPEYRQTGAIFWPDYGPLKPKAELWRILGLADRDEVDQESGQIVIDKKRGWKPLLLAMHFNEHSDFYYRYLWGDKDTFRIAWRLLHREYSMVPYPIHKMTLPGHYSLAMGQHDFEGNLIFQHRNQDKWQLDGRNFRLPGFRHEDRCRRFLAELAERWPRSERIGSERQYRPLRKVGRRMVRLPK